MKTTAQKVQGIHVEERNGLNSGQELEGEGVGTVLSGTEVLADIIVPLLSSAHMQLDTKSVLSIHLTLFAPPDSLYLPNLFQRLLYTSGLLPKMSQRSTNPKKDSPGLGVSCISC